MVHALRALRSPNYRLFFAGQFVSLLGTWLQTVAVVWLVYRLSGSPLLLGLTTGLQQLPLLLLSPVAGVWSDRHDRRKVLIVTQLLGAVQAGLLALLTFLGSIEVAHVMVLALALGLINAFETPTRQAFVLDMVGDKRDLPNAIALNSMLFNSARFVGPALAGVILAALGEAWCFALNALSFTATLYAYTRMRVASAPRAARTAHWLSDLREGVRYAFGFVGIRRLLLLLAVLSIGSAPWQPLMPVFASDVYGGDSRTLGWLIGAVGVGALCGTVYLILRRGLRGLGRVIPFTAAASGLGMTVFAWSQSLALALPMLALFGFGLIATVASCNTLIQTIAEAHMRGRVIALYVVAFLGMSPVGHFLSGALAERIGVQWTLFLCGASMMIAAACFGYTLPSWREAVRQARATQEAETRVPHA
ncbi:MAG: MFS transporter [Pseudomonadota bacterium]